MKYRFCDSAFTLIEAGVALAVSGIAIAGIMMLNSASLRLVQSNRMSNAASLVIQERVEQLRLTHWRHITDPNYIRGVYFASVPDSAEPLGDVTETLSLSSYPDETVTEKLQVKKSPLGSRTVKSGLAIPDHGLVRVDYSLEWLGEGGRPRRREASTILSKVGISTLNLAFAGGIGTDIPPSDSPTDSPEPSATPHPSASPSPTPTDTDEDSDEEYEEDEPPGNRSNGNGRGNIKGRPGTK